MRILLLSSWFPYPPDNGSRIRLFNMIRGLSKDHEITLMSLAESASEAMGHVRILGKYCREVKVVQRKRFRSHGRKAIMGFFARRPRYLVDTHSREMKTLVESAVRSNEHDLILASELGVGQYAVSHDSIPKILDDVEITIFEDQFRQATGWANKLRYGLTWWKFARYIEALLGDFDACTVVSQKEKESLAEIVPHYQAVEVIPNSVDLSLYNGDFGAPMADTLIYPGAVTYSANYDAVRYFLKDIYRLIADKKPGAIVRVTGRTNGVPVGELAAYGNVVFTGYVPDIRPLIAQSSLCIVPLRLGGGTRLKILESMALGTPVVSTSKGAEGLEVASGVNILVADTPARFAAHVVDVLEDRQLRERLSANAQKLVRQKYDSEMICQRFEAFIRDIVVRKRQ